MSAVKEESTRIYDMMYDECFKERLYVAMKARVPLINLDTTDERRALCFLEHFSRIKGYNYYVWNCFDGLMNVTTGDYGPVSFYQDRIDDPNDIKDVLKFILEDNERYDSQEFIKENKRGNIFVLTGIEHYLNDTVVATCLSLIYERAYASSIFFITPEANMPVNSNLKSKIMTISAPTPNNAEYENVFKGMLQTLNKDSHKEIKQRIIDDKSVLLEKIQGMDLHQAQTALAIQLITYSHENKRIADAQENHGKIKRTLESVLKT